MKKQVTKYYCDLCGKEVSDEKMLLKDCTLLGTRKVKVEGNRIKTSIVGIKNKDICVACASKLASLIEVDSKNNIKFVEPPKETSKPSVATKTTTTTKAVATKTAKTTPATKTVPTTKTVPATKTVPTTKTVPATKTTTTKSKVVSKPTTPTQKEVVKTRELPNPRDMVARDITSKQTFKMTNMK